MPVATGVSDRRGYLRDSELELAALSAASSTANGTAVAFDASSINFAKAVVVSNGYTSYSAGSAEWTVTLKAATSSGGTYATIAEATLPATAKNIELAFSGPMVTEKVGGRATHVKADVTKTGSPGAASATIYLAS